jgi:NTP pyrophosphatase (non-canonical NTP hydrolase)
MKEIIKYFGVDHQRRKFAEENLELQEAIIEYQNACKRMDGMPAEYAEGYLAGYKRHLIEEIADNIVLIGEFIKYFDIPMNIVEEVGRFKIKRTHNRIREEQLNGKRTTR